MNPLPNIPRGAGFAHLSSNLNEVLEIVVQIANFIKARPLKA